MRLRALGRCMRMPTSFSIGRSFLSDSPKVCPEMEKCTPSMLARRLVIMSEPAQECSTSPAGKGPSCLTPHQS